MLIKTTGRGPDYGKKICPAPLGHSSPSWRWARRAWCAISSWCPAAASAATPEAFIWGAPAASPAPHWANLLRNEWMLRHPERWKKARIQETDERSQRLTAQAAQLAGVATFFLQALAAFVLVAVDPMLVKVLLGSMLAYILFFLGARAALARRR